MQMFRKPVNSAIQGDRVALCVTQFDPKLLERGLVCAPGILPIISGECALLRKGGRDNADRHLVDSLTCMYVCMYV